MKTIRKMREDGFTLLEMMLVAVMVSWLIVMSISYVQQRTRAISIDRATAQMEQILNAGLSYYVNNGTWPTTDGAAAVNVSGLATLTPAYLPAVIVSPWGTPYSVSSTTTLFTVNVALPAAFANGRMIATVLAGRLPFGVATTPASPAASSVASSINIPGANLNNSGAINFAGIYHNGACVPAPSCPASSGGSSFTPQIMVSPASVSGMSDPNSTNLYPLESFSAYATAMADTGTVVGPNACGNSASNPTPDPAPCLADSGGTTVPDGNYWRVCLNVSTAKGDASWDSTTGSNATVMVLTRCGSSTENAGSDFTVFAQ